MALIFKRITLRFRCAVVTFSTALISSTAWACTVCDSETSQQVRAGILGDDFWTTFVGVIAPFPVLLILVAVYHYGVPNFAARASHRPEHPPL
jgi:hypothetical protein